MARLSAVFIGILFFITVGCHSRNDQSTTINSEPGTPTDVGAQGLIKPLFTEKDITVEKVAVDKGRAKVVGKGSTLHLSVYNQTEAQPVSVLDETKVQLYLPDLLLNQSQNFRLLQLTTDEGGTLYLKMDALVFPLIPGEHRFTMVMDQALRQALVGLE